MGALITCTPKSLPQERWVSAARTALEINPLNHLAVDRLAALGPSFEPTPFHIAVLTMKYWGTNGVHLGVQFLDNPSVALRRKILSHMNAWSKTANIAFKESKVDGEVRIAREDGSGYWSYVGTDIQSVPSGEQTMNLDGFTEATPESEFIRVVRHETGHTIGCPHEHMRRELVEKIDREKAIKYFEATQGWSEEMVVAQVLTPIEEASVRGTAHADPDSIMCYQIPGSITKSGKPIPGGLDIDQGDYEFIGMIYPKARKAASRGGKRQKRTRSKKRGSR